MMNKLLGKKSLFVMAVITGAVLILSLAFSMLFGVNYAANGNDYNTVTVQVNDYRFNSETDTVKDVCETVFDAQGVDYEYYYKSETNADGGELVYVFEQSVDHFAVTDALKQAFDTATTGGGVLDGAEVLFNTGMEEIVVSIPASYAWKAVFAVLALSLPNRLLRTGKI